MALIERRIGLLFAAFLVAPAPRRRPRALPGRDQGLEPAPAPPPRQQVSSLELPARARHDHRPPRRRARGLRARRRRLRHALPGQGPGADGGQARAAARRRPRRRSLRKLAERDSGFVYLARSLPAEPGPRRVQSSTSPGIELTAGAPPHLPARVARRAAARRRRHRRQRPQRPRVRRRQAAARAATASGAWSRTRSASRSRSATPSPAKAGARLELTLDAAIQDKVERVLGRRRRDLPPEGRDRDRHGPAHRRGARDGQLAARRRQRRRRRARLRDARTAPSASPTSRARPSRRSRSPARSQDGTVTPDTPFDLPPQIQVADRTHRRVARARRR